MPQAGLDEGDGGMNAAGQDWIGREAAGMPRDCAGCSSGWSAMAGCNA